MRERRRTSASIRSLALLFSPTVLLVASVLHPPHGADGDSWLAAASASSLRFYVAHVLFLIAAVALVPAAAAMAETLQAVGVRRARVAATLTAMGAFGIAAFVGTDLFVWRMAHGAATHSEMLVFLRDAASSPAVIGPMAVLLAAVALGVALFAIQLWRADALHAVPAAMLAGGPLLFGVLPAKPVSISGAVCLLVGSAAVAHLVTAPAVSRRAASVRARRELGARYAADLNGPPVARGRRLRPLNRGRQGEYHPTTTLGQRGSLAGILPEDPLDVGKMAREEREALKRRLIARYPDIAERILGPSSLSS